MSTSSNEENRATNQVDTTNVASMYVQAAADDAKSLPDEVLVPKCEASIRDLRDNLPYLLELRERFRLAKGKPILGYTGWQDFVSKNSAHSLRTIQRALAGSRTTGPKARKTEPNEAQKRLEAAAAAGVELARAIAQNRTADIEIFMLEIQRITGDTTISPPVPKQLMIHEEERIILQALEMLTAKGYVEWTGYVDGLKADVRFILDQATGDKDKEYTRLSIQMGGQEMAQEISLNADRLWNVEKVYGVIGRR